MRVRLLRMVPVLITLGVVSLLFLLEVLSWVVPRFNWAERVESLTYDWRVRLAVRHAPAPPSYIGAVYIDEETLRAFNLPTNGGYQYPLPRFLLGQAVEELAAQGAKAVAFDVFLLDRNYERDRILVPTSEGESLPSDLYLAQQLRRAGNVILGAPPRERTGRTVLPPDELFATNAAQVGFTSLFIDADGIRRKCLPFIDDTNAKRRFWHVGILLAAAQLNLDLAKAVVRGRELVIPGQGAVQRVIPLDSDGCFYVHWAVTVDALPPEQQNNLFYLWEDYHARKQGFARNSQFRDKLVVLGAAGAGNNVGDRGPTPVENETILCSSLWNVASSVIENRFVRRSSPGFEMLLVAAMAGFAALVTSRLRALGASLTVMATAAAYVGVAAALYLRFRYWLPVVLPVGGALLMTYACLVCYRLFIELVERRRVQFIRATFSQRFPRGLVDTLIREEQPGDFTKFLGLPPSVVQMLFQKEGRASQGGVRRRVSIFFADIRNFTEFIDLSYAQAEAHVRESKLPPQEAEQYLDLATRDVLGTVNLYLSTIAEVVRAHQGTLDKYVGDAVMAFWGAPTPDERHAAACVKAALAAQHAVASLNQQRHTENRRRQLGEEYAPAAGSALVPSLPILTVGIAINSGEAIVGFMGSAALMSNYTVFGKEVNVASRLEGVAASGRIVIAESTWQELQRWEPSLASSCIVMEPVALRGIRKPVRIYELPVPAVYEPAAAPAKPHE